MPPPFAFIKGAQSSIRGYSATIKMLEKLTAEAPARAHAAMGRFVKIIFERSQYYCPVDTGRLKATGRIVEIERYTYRIDYGIGRGRQQAPYAVYVHENTRVYHAYPTSAKFLERSVVETYPEMVARMRTEWIDYKGGAVDIKRNIIPPSEF